MTLTMARRRVSFEVLGAAETKGSAKAFVPKKWADEAHRAGKAPRAIVTNDNPSAKAWEQRIATEAQKVAGDGLFVGPVVLLVTFHLPRPKSLPKRVLHHTTRPDCDKAARCVLDALTGVLYHDDGQITELHVRKAFAATATAPRAVITVAAAADPDPMQHVLTVDEARDLFSMEA
jgi:crossover junction endodeoxyribonuclease RusA